MAAVGAVFLIMAVALMGFTYERDTYTAKGNTDKVTEEKEDTKPEKKEATIEKDRVFKLEEVKYTPQTATKIKTYNNYVEEPDIPNEIEFFVKGKLVKGELVSVSKEISETYDAPFSIEGKFFGDEDSMYYNFKNEKVSASNAPEFENYSLQLLEYLNLDENIYRIDRGSWVSEYYKEGNETVRKAIYSGMQKSSTYTATYKGVW